MRHVARCVPAGHPHHIIHKINSAADFLLLATDEFIGHVEKTLGWVVLRKKPGLKKKGGWAQLNTAYAELQAKQLILM
ncbi:MAG: hypothetical protein ACLP5H_34455 [Desulfomonilaceae bacterium]